MAAPPFVYLPHPIAGHSGTQIERIVQDALPAITALLREPPGLVDDGESAGTASARASRLEAPTDPAQLQETVYAWGWSDGLPVIPPEEARVAAMLRAVNLAPDEVLGVMPPREGVVLAEKVAANAVLAGAGPEHMPVILAAVRAILRPEFNIGGVAATTGGAAPVVIVSGPAAKALAVASGSSCFSLHQRANAVIARAIKLVIRNLAGAVPEELDRSTQGFPGKALCFAEREDESPWEPLHVELGFPREASTATVVAVGGMHQVSEHHGSRIWETLAGNMRSWGIMTYYVQGEYDRLVLTYDAQPRRGRVLVVLGPEHARECHQAGFTKRDLKQYLYERARLPKKELVARCLYGGRRWPGWIEEAPDDEPIPIVAGSEDIMVVVAGGPGRHSPWLPLWTSTLPVVEPVV